MTIRTERDPSLIVGVDPASARTTPEPAEHRFREVLEDGAVALLGGVEGATRVLPGGAMVTAALRGALTADADGAAGAGTGAAGGAARSLEEALALQADHQMQYIELQQRMQDENQRYTTLSNVLKARHETAKTAIGNIR